MNLTNKRLLKEWKKIEQYSLFDSFEDFASFYFNNGEKSCFRIFSNEPWSKDNFFFGDYNSLLEYQRTNTGLSKTQRSKIGGRVHSLTIKDIFVEIIDGKRSVFAKCCCDCGTEIVKPYDSIVRGNARTCGCILGKGKVVKQKDFIGIPDEVINEYWDFEKNIDSPYEIERNSDTLYWWKNLLGRSFQLSPRAFIKRKLYTSFPEQTIFFYVKILFPDAVNRYIWIKEKDRFEIDIYIPGIGVGIEYDGEYWHKEKEERDKQKSVALDESGIFLIRIREKGLPNILNARGRIIERDDNESVDDLIRVVNEVLRILCQKTNLKNTVGKITRKKLECDYLQICAYLFQAEIPDSIYNSELLDFWDYKKNKGLNPKNVDANTKLAMNFKCSEGVEIKESPCRIQYKVASYGKLQCVLSPFCVNVSCKKFKIDAIKRSAKGERRLFTGGYDYICAKCISENEFIMFISNPKSDLYAMFDITNEFLAFIVFWAFHYSVETRKRTLDIVYDYYLRNPNLSLKSLYQEVEKNDRKNVNLLFANKNYCNYIVKNIDLDELSALSVEPRIFIYICDELSNEQMNTMVQLLRRRLFLKTLENYIKQTLDELNIIGDRIKQSTREQIIILLKGVDTTYFPYV